MLTLAKVQALARKIKHPVYWAGPMKNAAYEVTYTPGGNFSVRYLPAGSKAGGTKFIATVSTYPFLGAYDSIRQLTQQGGMQKIDTKKGGALAVTSEAYPQSIRLAFPGKDFQIEVISPSVVAREELRPADSVRRSPERLQLSASRWRSASRSGTFSFLSSAATWLRTVARETNRRDAICDVDRPWRSRPRTSHSRLVRS